MKIAIDRQTMAILNHLLHDNCMRIDRAANPFSVAFWQDDSTVAGTLLGRVILEFPFVTEGIACFGQPFGIISQYFNLDAGKVFDRAGCRVSQRLQQTEADQDRDRHPIMQRQPGMTEAKTAGFDYSSGFSPVGCRPK